MSHKFQFSNEDNDNWNLQPVLPLSEIATRLNAKQHYDNRGRQIWAEGFEDSVLHWNTTLAAGATIAQSTNSSWRGDNSLLFACPAAAGAKATATRYVYLPETGQYGLEFAWSSDNNDCIAFIAYLEIIVPGAVYSGAIMIDGKNALYKRYIGLGFWTSLGVSVCQMDDLHFWHKSKVVVDVDALEYMRILTDGIETYMGGTVIGGDPSGAACRKMGITFQLIGDAAAAYNFYLDDVILTHLEP